MSTTPHWIDQKALEVARRFTQDTEVQRRASLQLAVAEAMQFARPDLAAPAPAHEQAADERAAFEAWFWLEPECKGDCWEAWEARAALASKAAAPERLDDSERAELERLRTLVHSPHTDEWMEAVNLEAAHQQERWGSDHDAGKIAEDWIFLAGHLMGKASVAFKTGDRVKGLHHIISSSAVLLNWHRNVTGTNTGMRPGIADTSPEAAAAKLSEAAPPAAVAAESVADAGALPATLLPVHMEWYTLCERAPHADKITISGALAEAIVRTVVAAPSAAPAPHDSDEGRDHSMIGDPVLREVFQAYDREKTGHFLRMRNVADLLRAARAAPGSGDADVLRTDGWAVAVHNDYRLGGVPHTFWLFTKDGRAAKGEGRTDADALAQVRTAIATHAHAAPAAAPSVGESADTACNQTLDLAKVCCRGSMGCSLVHREARKPSEGNAA